MVKNISRLTPTLSACPYGVDLALKSIREKPFFRISCMILRLYAFAHIFKLEIHEKISWHQKKNYFEGRFP